MSSYQSPKIILKPSEIDGKGLFATDSIATGELLIDFSQGKGKYISAKEADQLFREGKDHMIQVGKDRFFAAVSSEDYEDVDYLNHSCDPSAGLAGPLQIVALREISAGEEVVVDYAMFESSEYSFICHCNTAACRGRITGDDWRLPELQKNYKGYFAPYLQELM